ncbi:hypothetical protein DSECCO2_540230 [anaerobic digester metagenome]
MLERVARGNEKRKKALIEKDRKDQIGNELERYWAKQAVLPDDVFDRLKFLGAVPSRRNTYYCYVFDDWFLRFTELKEITRVNLYLRSEIKSVLQYISSEYPSGSFCASDLEGSIRNSEIPTQRIGLLMEEDEGDSEERDYSYYYLLDCCYILTALQRLSLSREGRGILFEMETRPRRLQQTRETFSSLRYLGNINDTTKLYENNLMFFTMRLKNFRGSMLPYIKEEIRYLYESLDPYAPNQQIDVESFMNRIDFSRRFHKIYSNIQYKNIRNDRPDRQYFVNRIKSGLEILSCLNASVRVIKNGRQRQFYRADYIEI